MDAFFVSLQIDLMLLNPKWKIKDTCNVIRERKILEKFVKYCVFRLSSRNDPSVETMKLQRYFTYNMEHLDEDVNISRRNLKSTLERLEDEIINANVPDDDGVNELYKKIVYYITLLSGLGDPTVTSVSSTITIIIVEVIGFSI